MINYKNKRSDVQIIKITVELWAIVYIDDIMLISSMNHGAVITIPGAPALSSTTNTTNVTPADIDASSFLKYINVKLTENTGVLNVYDNLVVQSQRFNIFIRPSTEITKPVDVTLDSMDPNCVADMGTLIHSKMIQVDTISEKYKDAHNLLKNNTDR